MISMKPDEARALLAEMAIPFNVSEMAARKAINSHIDSHLRLRALAAWRLVGGKPAPKPRKKRTTKAAKES